MIDGKGNSRAAGVQLHIILILKKSKDPLMNYTPDNGFFQYRFGGVLIGATANGTCHDACGQNYMRFYKENGKLKKFSY
ncbi:hypothetical protein ACIGC1_07220 [Peribacillus butanolivorans]|uniref:hypothetical protein n=1 Tax=Peribacillus butanolivorans TaxID=421767 RepID=UPI0037CB7059